MNIGYRSHLGPGFTSVRPTVKSFKSDNNDNRQLLSDVLFGKRNIQSSNITFGWSKALIPEEEEILDILTNPFTKTVMIGCHLKPDADATGSAIGIAGIVKKMGARALPVLDDVVPTNLKRLPTNHRGFSQDDFFKTSEQTKSIIKYGRYFKIDVAVLTDSALPSNVSDEMLKLACTAKKVVIIDHHCGDTGSEHYEKWLDRLTEVNPDFDEDNLIYWCDPDRSSASEMVAELDKEVQDEFESSNEDKYAIKHRYSKRAISTYRYSVAAGILDDSGARLNSLDEVPHFPRQSKKQMTLENGKKVSSTEAYYRWLVNNAGPQKVNLAQVNNSEKNMQINKVILSLLSGKTSMICLPIKVPEKDSNYGFLDLTNQKSLETLFNTIPSNANSTADVAHLFKLRALDKINAGESDLYAIATRDPDSGQVIIGAYSSDGLAKKVVNRLIKEGFGTGGGHDCACVIRLDKGRVLSNNIKEIIDEVVKSHKKDNEPDITSNSLRLLSEVIDHNSKLIALTQDTLMNYLKPFSNRFFHYGEE